MAQTTPDPIGGSGGIGGSLGATDNALVRADGTLGDTAQGSGLTVDDSTNLAGAASLVLDEQASAPVSPGAGEAALWVLQKSGAPATNILMFTDEDGLEQEVIRSVQLTRTMPASSGDSVELGSLDATNSQTFSIFVSGGPATSNDFVAYHRVTIRNAASTGGWVILQPLYTSGPLNTGGFGDNIRIEMDVAVGGVVSLRARSYINAVQDCKFRIVFDGDSDAIFTPSSTQATTTAPTANYGANHMTMTDAVATPSSNPGVVVWSPMFFEERAAANADVAGFGQLWVRDDTPSTLMFTNDGGVDKVLSRNVVDNRTAAHTITANEDGYTYTNTGATALVELTLPSASAGLTYTFYVADTDGIRINAAGGDAIRADAATVSTSGGYIESTTVDSCVVLRAINNSTWVAVGAPNGTWTAA